MSSRHLAGWYSYRCIINIKSLSATATLPLRWAAHTLGPGLLPKMRILTLMCTGQVDPASNRLRHASTSPPRSFAFNGCSVISVIGGCM